MGWQDEYDAAIRKEAEAAEIARLRAALRTADAAMARYCSHQVGYQAADVAFREARAAIKDALADQSGQTDTAQ